MLTLKNCPICKNDHFLSINVDRRHDNDAYHIKCLKCGFQSPYTISASKAADTWNMIAIMLTSNKHLDDLITFSIGKGFNCYWGIPAQTHDLFDHTDYFKVEDDEIKEKENDPTE